jgi:predicted RNA-binding Zn ribbon-like protein
MHNRDMFFTTVDGVHLPAAIAGHPALELCNTWAGWNSPPGTGGDYLRGYDDLAVWAKDRAALSEEETAAARAAADAAPDVAEKVLRETRRFRGHLYELLTSGGPEPAFRDVARLAHEARAVQRLQRAGDGAPEWRFATDNPVRLPLLAAAKAAADLLTGPDRGAVHACPGIECGWLFLDPRGRRKWCIMAVCGNRAKARAYAERRAGHAPAAT